MSRTEPSAGASGGFPTTLWTVVLAARDDTSESAAQALEALCRAYWSPIYTFARRRGNSPEDAQDLTQEFFARLIGKNYLRQVDQSRGRFRSFLLGALKHFLADEWDRSRALKRGGGRELLSLDDSATEARYRLEPAEGLSPDRAFDRRWALALMERGMARLEADYVAAGRRDVFLGLRGLIAGGRDAGFAEAAARLNLTEGAAKMAVQRMRRRYRELLRAEVRDTVASEAEIDDELRYLMELVSD